MADPMDDEAKRAYAIVGELVLIASALDHQLNHICISVLALTESPMLESVVASIDSARKIEILRGYATKITSAQWKMGLKDHADAVEAVNRARNIAAHSVMLFEDGKPVLHSPAAAKLFKAIDLKSKTAAKTNIGTLERAIRKAEVALSSGGNLLKNFERVAAERERRKKGP